AHDADAKRSRGGSVAQVEGSVADDAISDVDVGAAGSEFEFGLRKKIEIHGSAPSSEAGAKSPLGKASESSGGCGSEASQLLSVISTSQRKVRSFPNCNGEGSRVNRFVRGCR